MFKVYVLYSKKYKKVYIGFTSNLQERFKSHNELATKGWTIKFRPWDLVFIEEFQTKSEALKREKNLKGAKGRDEIWKIIYGRING